jgi:hypothetical protein
MRGNFGFRISDFGFAFALLVTFAATSSAQTLADIARQERERQRQVRGRVITITPGVQGAAVSTGVATAAGTAGVSAPPAAATAGQKPTGPVDNQGRDEKYWRTQFQKARDDLKRAEAKVQILDLKIKDMNTQLLQNSVIYNREYRIGPEIAAAQQELEAARKEVEVAKQRIPQLEDDLRRAGGLPGWAR